MKVVLVSAALALALGGCSTELDGFGAKPSAMAANRVLTAPTAAVESSPVPGNVSTTAADTATGAITPRTTASNVPLTPPPANPGATAFAPSAAKEQVSGAWSFSWDGGKASCPVRLGTDRGLSGLSAQADVSCPSEIFMTKGWDMMGSDIVLQNHQGKVTARLQPDGPNHYVGTIAETGQQVALAR
ncbi:MAG: protease inhibitor Inh/omp19 family protein [Rhizobiales bacterium]|nr:protease inhibitor Inh/omp19 family protein [Hyphomicrobiales bacterium]